MLYQPTNIMPSSFAGVGGDLIDAADGMTVSWQVNGTSPMTAYRLDFYANDAASTPLFSTGRVALSAPFFGTDGSGNVQRFSVPVSAATLSSGGVVNGEPAGYKYKITQWWSVSDSVEQTADNWFSAMSKPTVSITTTTVTVPEAAIAGAWSQAQGVGLDWVRWQVYFYGNSADPTGGGLVDDTGRIHTQLLRYSKGGWMRNTTYYIVLSYQFQNGYAGQTDALVTASWNTYAFVKNASMTAGTTPDCAGLLVKYPIPTSGAMAEDSGGTVTDDGRLSISGTPAVFNGYYLEPFTSSVVSAAFSTVLDRPNLYPVYFTVPCSLYGAYSSVELRLTHLFGIVYIALYSGGTMIQGTEKEYLLSVTERYGDILTVIINSAADPGTAGSFVFQVSDSAGNVKHRTTAADGYPGLVLDMAGGGEPGDEFTVFSADGVHTLVYAGLARGHMSGALTDALLAAPAERPAFTADWLYLTNFVTGNIGTLSNALEDRMRYQGMYVYRRAEDENAMRLILHDDAGADGLRGEYCGAFADYAAVSGKKYAYTVIYSYLDEHYGDYGTATVAFDLEAAAPCWWNWNLVTAEADSAGVYHMTGVYKFALNLETGAMSNNNTPNLLQNFTPYPTRQGTTANYRTGSLTAYIGTVEDNAYVDTAAQARAIMALSTDGSAKFLKSRKGEIWMVDTSAPVSVNVGDRYREQPYAATLSWTEIGSTDGVSVVSVPTDGAWSL